MEELDFEEDSPEEFCLGPRGGRTSLYWDEVVFINGNDEVDSNLSRLGLGLRSLFPILIVDLFGGVPEEGEARKRRLEKE